MPMADLDDRSGKHQGGDRLAPAMLLLPPPAFAAPVTVTGTAEEISRLQQRKKKFPVSMAVVAAVAAASTAS